MTPKKMSALTFVSKRNGHTSLCIAREVLTDMLDQIAIAGDAATFRAISNVRNLLDQIIEL